MHSTRARVYVSTVIIKNYFNRWSIYPRPFIVVFLFLRLFSFVADKCNEYRRFREKLCKSPSHFNQVIILSLFIPATVRAVLLRLAFFPLSSSPFPPFSLTIPFLHLPPLFSSPFPAISNFLFPSYFPAPHFQLENNRETNPPRMIFPHCASITLMRKKRLGWRPRAMNM